MLGILSISLLFTIFQAVTSGMPEHCKAPPSGVEKPGDCCKIPPVFTEEDFKECGIEKPGYNKHSGPPDCAKHVCLLKKYDLMKDDENINKEALAEFFDKWANDNPEFKEPMAKSKDRCLSADLPGPPHICEPVKVAFCVMITTFQACPTWEDSDNCKKLKDHMEECKGYLPF